MEINAKAFGYVVLFLGVALLLALAGIVFLAATDNDIPEVLAATPGAITTGLIGLLVKTPAQPPVGKDEA